MRLLDVLLSPVRWAARLFTRAPNPKLLAAASADAGAPKRAPLTILQAGASAVLVASQVLEPYGRSLPTDSWTPTGVRAAESNATSGNLRYAADLCDTLFADDHFQSVIGTRARGLLGLVPSFEKGTGRKKHAAAKALEAEEDWWTIFPEEELSALMRWGIVLGVGIGQLIYPEGDPAGGRLVPRLKVWHPRWLRWDWQQRKWFLKVNDGAQEIEITPGDGQWVLYLPYGSSRPWASGLWRGLARWYLLKLFAIEDMGLWSEVQGQPLRVITAPKDTSIKLRRELVQDLQNLGRETSLCLPDGFTIQMIAAPAGSEEMFLKQVNAANDAMSIATLGGNLGTSVRNNQQTGSTAQENTKIDLRRYDGETVASTTHDQVLVHWAEYNFGTADAAPWPSWPTDPPEDTAKIATVWKTAAYAISLAAAAGYDIDVDDVLLKFGMKLTKRPGAPALPPPGEPGEHPAGESGPAPEHSRPTN